MYVSEINSAKAVSVRCDISAAKAYQQIREVEHSKFPVVDKEGKLVGIVDKDVLADISSFSITKVRDLMYNNVYYAKETDTIWEAALNMKDHRVSILPVVNEDGELLSVLARNDLFKALLNFTGAKYEGCFIYIDGAKEDIFKAAEAVKAAEADLLFISSHKNKIAVKTAGKNAEKAVSALEATGFKIIYTVKIN